MFPSLATPGNITRNIVSATMFPSLARPIDFTSLGSPCPRFEAFQNVANKGFTGMSGVSLRPIAVAVVISSTLSYYPVWHQIFVNNEPGRSRCLCVRHKWPEKAELEVHPMELCWVEDLYGPEDKVNKRQRAWENGLNPGEHTLDWKWSSGWLESWEGLLLATEVLATSAEAIFGAKGIQQFSRDWWKS